MTDSLKLVPSVIALGMFDGMHLGHRALVRRCVEIARDMGCQSVVYTFRNHPRSVFATEPVPLMSAAQRESIMRQLGVDRVDMVEFTREFASLPPKAFLETIVARYDVRAVVVGEDYTFGYRGQGNAQTLKCLGQEMGFQVEVIPFVRLYGEKVSSTRVREALANGDTQLARALLGSVQANREP
ncbi:MAG: FAD synthetase family protein [Clostridia bacterium]|nr:FAD synthetase family protein [Clostridia bacterium]